MTTTDRTSGDSSSVGDPPRSLPLDADPPAEVRTASVPTKSQRRRTRLRTIRAWFVLLLVLAVCGTLAVHQVDQRLARRDHVDLHRASLTAEPVDVVATSAASVIDIDVEPRQAVKVGDAVAVVDAIRPAPGGGQERVRETLVAPIDGVVASVPTNVGAAVLPGGIVVRLYDPAQMHFVVSLSLDTATRLKVGMTGRLDSHVTGPEPVTVSSIEPALEPGPRGDVQAVVKLAPVDPASLRNLLPGLLFDGYVDQRTAP